jgi:hypothetical protein
MIDQIKGDAAKTSPKRAVFSTASNQLYLDTLLVAGGGKNARIFSLVSNLWVLFGSLLRRSSYDAVGSSLKAACV